MKTLPLAAFAFMVVVLTLVAWELLDAIPKSTAATIHPILATNLPLPAFRVAGYVEPECPPVEINWRQGVEVWVQWSVETNWVDSGVVSRTLLNFTGTQDPNVTTYHQYGQVQSNLVAYVVWKGVTNGIVLESIPIPTAGLDRQFRK